MLMSAVSPSDGKRCPLELSAIRGTSGLLALTMSFVARDPNQSFDCSRALIDDERAGLRSRPLELH
jgi:hypothetical protein